MSGTPRSRRGWKARFLIAFLILIPPGLRAASYLPLSDADLARRSPVIARAEVQSKTVRLERINAEELPFTIVTLRALETVKGALKAEEFQLRLPGGQLGDLAWWIPGTPAFEIGEEVLLFVEHIGDSEYRLTELGMARFSIVEDEQHNRFAVRPSFEPVEDDFLSMRRPSLQLDRPGEPLTLRDSDSFLRALRSLAGNGIEQPVEYREPAGEVSSQKGKAHPLWVNIGGVEGGTLFRWFWDTGASPTGVVHASGTQTNLSDSSDGTTHVQNAVDQWGAVPSTSVAYAGLSGSGNVTVYLDASTSFDGSTWTTPLACSNGGIIGLGGPGSASGPRTFKGDGGYYAPHSGTVSMRQRTGSAGCYSAAVFRSAVLHELGHTLGLGHPDQGLVSIHSTTSSAAWAAAVMAAVIHSPYPDSPMTDDAQAISWYYGTGSGTPPTANFTFSPASPVTGQTVSFTNTSTGSPTSWSWNFGDVASGAANTSTLQNPTHVFNSQASYVVTLTATNAAGSNQIQKLVTVFAGVAPSANFNFAPSNPVTGQTVSFTDTSTGNPTSWSWNFGDGLTSTAQNPTHAYASSGTFNVTLTASNANGPNQIIKSVSVATAPPSANFTFSPSHPVTGQTVSMTDTSTGAPTSWSWNFGDVASGAANTSALQNPTHVFGSQASYVVTLTITNANGSNQAQKTVAVTSGALPPTANFGFLPSNPVLGQTVSFIDSSSGSPTSWSWNFGDVASGGTNTSTLQNPTHVFSSQATYVVSLTVTNGSGSNQAQKLVTVSLSASPVTASFNFLPGSPQAGQTVSFNDISTGSPTSWSWNFGDGNSSSEQNPAHAYAAAGTYAVQLQASNADGSSLATRSVTVSPPTGGGGGVVSLPVAGHVTGAGGIVFFTDVQIQNPNNFPVTAGLSFSPVGGGTSNEVSLVLGPLETQTLSDVVASQFGVTNSFGALRLDAGGAPAQDLRMTSRTYDESAGGTFGMAISGLTSPESMVASTYVTGIQRNSAYRTNLGAVNASNGQQSFYVVLRGSNGAVLGTSAPVTLPAGGQWQLGIKDLFPSVFGTGMTAEFHSVLGSTVPFAYGTLADNLSGDLTYYPSLRPGALLYLPVMSRITGVGGALFQAEFTLANVSDSSANVTVTFLEHDKDNSASTHVATLTLAPRETRLIDDALSALFGLSQTFGAVKVASTQPIVLSERIYTTSPTTPGTVGQQVDPVTPETLYSHGSILGLRQDASFRSNIGLFNPNGVPVLTSVTLRRPNGEILGSTYVTIPPDGMTQANLGGLFPGIAFPQGEHLTVMLDAGQFHISGYGIIADNVSQDLTASPGLP